MDDHQYDHLTKQLAEAAKTLARWCYERGIDERILRCDDQLLRRAVDQALSRPAPPAHLERLLWHRTATLLSQRRAWDLDHHRTPPPASECPHCAVAPELCPEHARRCRGCADPMHPITIAEGYDTHPCCDRAPGNGPAVGLERLQQILDATPLAQSA